MLAIENVLDILVFRVKTVHYYTGVEGLTGSEYNYLEVGSECFEDLDGIWSDVYASLEYFTFGKCDIYLYIMRHLDLLVAVDQSLVEIKHYGFLA